MALRFSGSAPSHDGAASPLDLPGRGEHLLAIGDLEGYRKLFARTEPIADPHRRYWAVCQLIERGLVAAADVAPRALPDLFVAVATGALDALEREPREPKLLNYAGVALYELWSVDAAHALFQAAKRLDPKLAQVDRNLAEATRRRQAVGSGRRRAPLRPAVEQLRHRATAVAARAAPASGLKISLCMIVRDEQEMLPRCLRAVVDAVDEIVIVDTGSVDRTIEIARSFGARVIEREWTGSFADARNVSFDAARGDWLLYLDADEVLMGEDTDLLRGLTGRTWREAFYLAETNYTGELDAGTAVTHNALRVFRNRPEYRFEGRLHEQIARSLPGYLPERLEATGIRVEHYGYLGVVRDGREKSRRNIELLRKQQAESPSTPFLHYNLGSEYAAAGDAPAALVEFQRAWRLLEADPERDLYEFAPALANRLVKALRVCGQLQAALDRAEEALERFPGFTDLVLEQAVTTLGLGQTQRAIDLYERCIEMGDADRRYTATVGCGTYLPRIALGEVRLARGEVEQAIELLEHCVVEYPEFAGSVLPYASALLAGGLDADAVVARVERQVSELSVAGRFMLGTALYEAGATAAGETQFRAVMECQPHSSRARVALGEVLLAQRRYADAAATAAGLPVEDPFAVIACRTELFARIAGADAAHVSDALDRARDAGMPVDELDLFAAWQQLARDGETGIALSREAVPLLGVALEALLRVQDLQSFEVLRGVLDRTPLTERERRQLLAEIYLRRGLIVFAAEQWMAVCERAPDVAALLGLARIAELKGMPTEAIDFASAALAREPQNRAANTLLSRVQKPKASPVPGVKV